MKTKTIAVFLAPIAHAAQALGTMTPVGLAAALLALCSISPLQAVVISAATGSGDGVNYTVSLTGGDTGNVILDFGGDGDIATGSADPLLSDAAEVTFAFDAPVNFYVATAVTSSGMNIFDGGPGNIGSFNTAPGATNTFEANTGTWTFNLGSGGMVRTPLSSNSGTTIEFGVTGRTASDPMLRGDDFGSFHILGITEVVWTKTSATNAEAFNFSYTAIPEPSAALLINLAGILGLLLRRRTA